MIKKLKTILSRISRVTKPQKELDIDLNVKPNLNVNFEIHPQCPKNVSFSIEGFHLPMNKIGVFSIEANDLHNWMINRNRGRSLFELNFTEWLEKSDEQNQNHYKLSPNTIHETKLEFVLNELENGLNLKCHCPACGKDISQDDMKLEQHSSGGWVYRLIFCRCGNQLASYEVMHFMLKTGAQTPKRISKIVKNFSSTRV